ncbi:MAG: histidine phosphatase family protein [Alphaproteobacteria bacterium]
MHQLILLRHAKAMPAGDDADDFARALADAGRADAPLVAQALAEAGAAPQIAIVSDARRTRETWDLAQPSFPKVEVRFLRSLYLGAAETLMAEAERTGAANVMVVAHNPGLHELASRLAQRPTELDLRLRAKFPTAAAAIFARKSEDTAWKLGTYVTPKELRS